MTKQKAASVCVPFSEAEPVRRTLRQLNILRDDLLIKKDETSIYFPVKEVTKELSTYVVVTKAFEEKNRKPHTYKDLVSIPEKLRQSLPTSYDVIGDIILIKLPKDLLKYQKKIGKALLDTHPHVHTVCSIDPVAGELRTRDLAFIAGEHQTRTIHTEYGLLFTVDVLKTYFSPRLASERKRIAAQVKPGETIVDMFTGVAPFPVTIARYAKPKIIYAVDKNIEAIQLAHENILKNHVLDHVEVIEGDAKDICELIPVKANRIIMNLPFSAFTFFSQALSIANTTNCTIHYYDIIKEEDIQRRIEELKGIAQTSSFTLSDVTVHKIKTYAPREFYIGIDITATKHADVA
jgi:tRNA (guanine37-N1)-methyltransferase